MKGKSTNKIDKLQGPGAKVGAMPDAEVGELWQKLRSLIDTGSLLANQLAASNRKLILKLIEERWRKLKAEWACQINFGDEPEDRYNDDDWKRLACTDFQIPYTDYLTAKKGEGDE